MRAIEFSKIIKKLPESTGSNNDQVFERLLQHPVKERHALASRTGLVRLERSVTESGGDAVA